MKHIMVVFTGGTIGSTKQGSSINVNASGSYMILEQYKEKYDRDTSFDTLQPMNILSENLLAEQWLTLAQQLKQIPQDQYEGIIITHGSDTLAYSAAMLSYLLSATTIPIVLIASNYPLSDERANGLRNFSEAVAWIKQEAPAGVFVVYENGNQESKLYLGSRIMQCETFTDQFRSPYELTLGTLKQGHLTLENDKRNPDLHQLKPIEEKWRNKLDSISKLEDRIIYIKPYPGLNYDLYQWSQEKPKAIVHDLYHSGTACSVADGAYSLPVFVRRCREQGIDVYLTPVKDAEEAQYASTAVLLEAGAILLDGIGLEAAITKLMIAYSLNIEAEQVITFMKQSLYYEMHFMN